MFRSTLLILVAVVFPWANLLAAAKDQITIFIPAFEGGPVATKVATFMNLKLWRTLRIPPKSDNYDTSGMVLWSHQPLSGSSYEIAEKAAKNEGAQLVLWGSAAILGDGAVVQCFLSIPEYEDSRTKNPERWIVKLFRLTRLQLISRSRSRGAGMSFSPITVKQELLKRYSLPSALVLYHSPNDRSVVGQVGDAFRGLEHDGDYSRVLSEDTGAKGWIYVPELSADTEIVNFTGGLIRLLRADYAGAIQLFRKVQSSDAGTSVKYRRAASASDLGGKKRRRSNEIDRSRNQDQPSLASRHQNEDRQPYFTLFKVSRKAARNR